MLCNDCDGTPHIPVREAALGNHLEIVNADARLAIAIDMHMRRLMVCRINHEAKTVLAKNRDHGDQ